MKKLARLIACHPYWVSLIGTGLAIFGAYYTVLLYKDLRTDIEELLPTTSRSVLDLNEVTNRIESIENIVVLAFSDDTKSSKKFIIDLANRLDQAPKSIVSAVEYKVDQEIKFFKDRQALFIDLNDLLEIKKFVRDRIQYEKELYNPLTLVQTYEMPEPHFDFEALKRKYAGAASGFDHLPGGFYATQDEKVRMLVAYMPGKGMDPSLRLKTTVEKAVEELNPQSYAPDLQIKYTGNVANMLEESAALVEDLVLSTVIVVILVTLAMLLFYRTLAGTAALVLSLFMGIFWTFGASYFLVGYLNANTAFLASIVIGNGINFGIILLARYLEDRRTGMNHVEGVVSAIDNTWVATIAAALAAGVSYGSLMRTGFRGFNQFGVIGLVGMILCWMSSFTLLPSYLGIVDRWARKNWYVKKKDLPFNFPRYLAIHVEKFSAVICVATLVALVASVFAIGQANHEIIETDLLKLRDKRSITQGAGALYHYISDIYRRSFSPMVILPKDKEDTQKIAELINKEIKSSQADPVIASVQTLNNFVPNLLEEKINVLKEIQRLLPFKIRDRLAPQEQRLVSELLTQESMKPYSVNELPSMIRKKFTEKDGSLGKIVLVEKVFIRDRDDALTIGKFVTRARTIADSVVPNTAVAGQLAISHDMFQAILKDGPTATITSLVAVVLLVIILFRNISSIFLILFALALGIIWYAGAILAFDLKINFLNFIALPITFGIGVDYAVNIFKRYEQEGKGTIIKVIENTGGAVILSSLTTMIGYSSLLIAGNQAFVSFGKLAVLGEITCIIAAVISLPAFLQLAAKIRPKTVDLTVSSSTSGLS